jgi:hypothetical protein
MPAEARSHGGVIACVTQKWPLVSLFPRARWVAASQKSASVNSPVPANGIVTKSVRVCTNCKLLHIPLLLMALSLTCGVLQLVIAATV